ncbi:metallophosphoesterase [Parafrankia sp. EUN1f]|uniref:metallophosphoesterase n=1 Tax=Parafrankia sp. EUN1f TaxID=102897 RepID=UPI0001C46CA2|nr:metallophosphoesterase [Parafrankia sp. EUN1f]EFC80448.1 metallophosphoesterase [Parafrankia sp. EUN1f]
MVVLSDVHIATNSPTNWYQAGIHEPYLVATFDWIVENADLFQEVILLGDLVDLWTFPPDVRPPSMADIIAANPRVLGPGGALARVVATFGSVTYVLGNHDGTLTADDLDALRQAVGPVRLVDPVYIRTGVTGARTVFSHGHHWTMFNAPDPTPPWAPLPIGHFVTRSFAHQMARRLQAGQSVADLPDMGYPAGINLDDFLRTLDPMLHPDLSSRLLDYVADVAGLPRTAPIVLPDGTTTTIDEAASIYAHLFSRWEKEEGLFTAGRAALADSSAHLAWFAQRLAIQHSADLVVFGHTHRPMGGLTVSPVNYVNSGFECAAVPDHPHRFFTFTVVDLDAPSADIRMVEPAPRGDQGASGHRVVAAPVEARHSAIVPPALDFSCYVRIHNEGSVPLRLAGSRVAHGHWIVPPPREIAAGGRADAWLQHEPGLEGSGVEFIYTRDGKTLPFEVSCPTGPRRNTAAGADGNFVARSGAGDWARRGHVPTAGHPLQVVFTVAEGS